MKPHIVSLSAVFAAAVSLAFTLTTRHQYKAAELETRAAADRIEDKMRAYAKPNDEAAALSSRLSLLDDRMARLERDMRADDDLRLLTDITTQLLATAKKADQSAHDLEGIRGSVQSTVRMTQASMNAVAIELASIKAELKKKADAK